MEGNGRGCRSRWDNAANVAQALRAAAQAWTGGAAANSAAPPLSEASRAAARSLGKLVPLRELLVSFCGWFVSTSLSPCLLTEKRKLRLQSCLSWTTLWAGGENGSAHPDHFDEAARRIP